MLSRVPSLLLLSAVLVAGCGGGVKPPAPPADLIPVTGTVKVGGKPSAGVMVNLTPTGTTKGQGAWGKADDAGHFKMVHMSQAEGVEPGEYIITFSQFIKPDGTPIPPNTSPTDAMAVQGIAAPWSTPSSESFKQKVTVKKDGMQSLDFDVPAARKRS